jgi:hypothetical protein
LKAQPRKWDTEMAQAVASACSTVLYNQRGTGFLPSGFRKGPNKLQDSLDRR